MFEEKQHLNSLGDNCMHNKFDLFASISMTLSLRVWRAGVWGFWRKWINKTPVHLKDMGRI